MTGIGMISAVEPAIKTSSASQMPAKIPAHWVCAPADVATPVRESDTLGGEVAGHVAAAAIRVRNRRGDSCGLRQRDKRNRDPADQQLRHYREIRNGQRGK
jgi:hypothetical protein